MADGIISNQNFKYNIKSFTTKLLKYYNDISSDITLTVKVWAVGHQQPDPFICSEFHYFNNFCQTFENTTFLVNFLVSLL